MASQIVDLSIGSVCESITNSVIGGRPKDFGPSGEGGVDGHIITSGSVSLYDTGTGAYMLIPSSYNASTGVFTINNTIGFVKNDISYAEVNPGTGQPTIRAYTFVTNLLDKNGFEFYIQYNSQFNQTRKERVIINARNGTLSGAYIGSGTKITQPTTVAGLTSGIFSGVNYSVGIAAAGDLISSKLQSEIYEVIENSYSVGSPAVPRARLNSIKLKTGDTATYQTWQSRDVTFAVQLATGAGGFTSTTKIGLKRLGSSSASGVYLRQNKTEVDLDLGTSSPNDIGSFRLAVYDNGTYIGLGLAPFSQSAGSNGIVTADNALGYIIFDVNGRS
jgi:hypothetical protein